jgi:hypothetical protein
MKATFGTPRRPHMPSSPHPGYTARSFHTLFRGNDESAPNGVGAG